MSTAQAEYLAIVSPVNDETNQLTALPSTATLAQVEDQISKLVNALTTALSMLSAGRWPTSVEPSIQALVAAGSAEESALNGLKNDTTLNQVVSDLSAHRSALAGSGAAANNVRAALGLPPSTTTPSHA